MPIINVSISDHASQVQDNEGAVKEVAERLTESTVRVLKKERELVVVRFDDTPSHAWFLAGAQASSSGRRLFEVAIKVTEGTNTQEEVSTWAREVYETMIQVLGESEGPNYISVQKIPQESWGYDGLTQYGRKKWTS